MKKSSMDSQFVQGLLYILCEYLDDLSHDQD